MGRINRRDSANRKRSISGVLLGGIGNLLMLAFIIGCLGLVIPHLAGYDAYVVVSGSMEPTIPVRSIVFAKKTDPAELQSGDVIVFVDPRVSETPITHRIVSNNIADSTVITKGDANESQDPDPIIYDNIRGRVDSHVPRMGFVAAMLTSGLGKIVAVLMLAEAWLLREISRRLNRR